jgi:hypothetical protein
MAIFKPESSTKSNTSFFGICELKISEIEDKSSQYDWADIYLDIVVNQKGSEYTRNMRIVGSLDKDASGNITGGSVLKRMYKFFDAIGCKAGLNVKGGWETEEGVEIESISHYLNENFITPLDDFDYIGYIYKEQPKKAGDKAWTKVYPKIYRNTEENKVQLKDDIQWLKGKGFLKEFVDEPANNATQETSNSMMSNL